MSFEWVTRAEWGSLIADVRQEPDAKPEVFIHHVAGRTPTSLMDERLHMRELQIYAINGKGGRYPVGYYSDMDYNVLIGPSGVAYEGRGLFGRSAATKDRNGVSRAVCLMGNTDVREPTRAQLVTLPPLLKWMIDKGSLRRDVIVYGHYQNPAHPNATSCPGRFMQPHLPAVRLELVRLLQPVPQPTPTPVVPLWVAATGGSMLRFVGNSSRPDDPTRWVCNGQVRTLPTFESANYLIRTKQVTNDLSTADLLTPAELAGLPIVG